MDKIFIRRVVMVVALLTSMFVLQACNTVHGAGKDVQKGGEKIQDAADAAK